MWNLNTLIYFIMRKLLVILNLIFVYSLIWSQAPESTAVEKPRKGVLVTGKVVDKNSGEPLEFATISLHKKSDNNLIAGSTSKRNGEFTIETSEREFYIRIGFLGYNTKEIREYSLSKGRVNLKSIAIEPDSEVLDEIAVVGEKSQTVFKLDKRVFNVGKDLSGAGGSALDILNNVPSVDVSIEGNVSLRGNTNVQILINGAPSVLTSGKSNTLGTITADMIEKVEVITNPSAKYEAKGTSGIINIVLAKDERRGLNGAVTVNTGFPTNHSVGLSLNRRTEKLNLFTQLGAGKRVFLSDIEGITENKSADNYSLLKKSGDSEKNEEFYNLRLGADFHIDSLNTITLSGHFAYEIEDEYSDNTFNISGKDGANKKSYVRKEDTEATNPKYQYELQYKRDFADHKDRLLLARATGFFFGKDKKSSFTNKGISGMNGDEKQKSTNDFYEAQYNFQLDYTHPFAEVFTLETGSKYDISDILNDYSVSDYDGGVWKNNDSFTNKFDYFQAVLGVYTTFAYEGEKYGVKAGARVENTSISTKLKNDGSKNDQDYTDFFGSLHTSYKLNQELSLQLGYSRRINRPHMWDLNPFNSIRDNHNIFTGNPDLKPTYTDSYEFTTIYTLGRTSMSFALFHRNSEDVVNDVITILNNITITSPDNVGESKSTGVELNGKAELSKWMVALGDFDYMQYNRTGEYNNQKFDFDYDRWSGRLTTKFKLPYQFDVECRVRYNSKMKELLTERKSNYYADFGVRKKLFKGRGIINFSIRDVFGTRMHESVSDQSSYYIYNKRSHQPRFVLGFSYGFGKGEAMEFSGHKFH